MQQSSNLGEALGPRGCAPGGRGAGLAVWALPSGIATAAPRFAPDHAEADHENAKDEEDGDADDEEDAEREEPEPQVTVEQTAQGLSAAFLRFFFQSAIALLIPRSTTGDGGNRSSGCGDTASPGDDVGVPARTKRPPIIAPTERTRSKSPLASLSVS